MTDDSRSRADSSRFVITRFAPSPTGRLHLGHALSAFINHRYARDNGGRFVLRIEDIDTARCRREYIDAMLDDLRWLGLDWDALELQTDHAAAHSRALQQLRDAGLIYPCICTRSEIAASASAPHGDGGPVYPGTCRGRPVADIGSHPVAWRLDMARAAACTGPLTWFDSDAGMIDADPIPSGDIVLARKGLGVAYHLAVVVDDSEAGVTDVIRGRDLFGATHVQRLLQALLGLRVPMYRHHRLVSDDQGIRLAKRTPGATLADLREAGTDPAELINVLLAGRLPVGFGWVSR